MGKIKDFMRKHEGVIDFIGGAIAGGVAAYIGYKMGENATELRISMGMEILEKEGYFSFLDPHKSEFITAKEAYKLLKQDGVIK